ncbi:hypothetical protein BDZ45DRAFT_683994 [Acephala macrosclerotiorum]|nr:hypothetical protein BDZ45DRAFT_683994 [Acephala macrosclerotiorum]
MEAPSVSDFFATAGLDPMLNVYSFDAGIEGDDYLDENTNRFETFNPEHGEHQPGYPWVDSENSMSQPTYTENCPYKKREIFDNFSVVHKKFRLVEEFSEYEPFPETRRPDWLIIYSGMIYTGDSYGSCSYIDANEGRACPQSCFCWLHDQAPGVFTFIAHKSSSRLVVNIYSDALYSEVTQAIGPENMAEEGSIGQDGRLKSLNGFYLLQSFQNLQAHLILLRSYAFTDLTLYPVISEMELLVHGFLADGEAFKSFGYEHLYENGFLTFEQWKAFQEDQLQRDISTLDERFIAIDDSNDSEDFEDSQDPVQLFGISSEDFEAVETQPDGNPMGSSQSAQYFVAETNFIEELEHWLTTKLLGPSEFENVVKYILYTGAAANGVLGRDSIACRLLIAAAFAGHEEIVRLLLSQGALDIDFALIGAARAGHAAVVSLLLGHDRATKDYSKKTFWYLGQDLLERSESQNGEEAVHTIFFTNLNPGVFEMSDDWIDEQAKHYSRETRSLAANDIALIEAAAAGHEEVVKILLDNGATMEGADMMLEKNAVWTRVRKVPVLEAAKAGHGAVVRLLLQRGAVVSSLQPLMSPFITKKEDPTFRRLNKRFIQQYRLMTEATLDSSTDFSQPGTRFKNHREAWNAGISTMRRLCNGKPPRGLPNTVGFLCISRAMSETLDSTNGSDYTSQFLEDLERWQVLFTSNELEAYRELIHSMWGTVLSENKSKSWKASDFLTLTHFQALLSTLIRQANEPVSLHGPHDQSLRCSQQRFLARSHQSSAEPEVGLPTASLDSSDGSNPQPPDDIEPKPPDIPIAPEKIPLKEHIENDISAASLNVTVVVLAAGAIFAIVIIFLQWLRDLSNGVCFLSMTAGFSYNAEIHDLQDRCQVLTAYLSLKADSAVPSPSSIATRFVDLINMPSSVDQLDDSKKTEIVVDPFGESSLLHFSGHGSQSMASPDEPQFAQQGVFSSPHASAVCNTPLSTSAHGTAMSSSDGTQTSPNTQHSTPISTKPPQKFRRICPTCKKKILAMNLKRHLKDHTGENRVNCTFCGKSIGRKEYLQRHERERCPLRNMGRKKFDME